jgi:hypothetical protein
MTRYGAAETPGEHRFGGLSVPDPAFAADDGSADAGLAEALAAYAGDALDAAGLAAALAGKRLMVPLVAVLDEVEEVDGLRTEKSSHMATVTLVADDGRRGLLAFTSVAAMAAWDPAARGIPARAETVAAAALEEDASAVLLDVAGPLPSALARGLLADVCAADPATVRDLVARAVPALPGLVGHDVQVDETGPVTVLLDLAPGAEASAADLAQTVADAVSADPAAAAVLRGGLAIGLLGATEE